ncbi:MAG TPA: acetolactate synthase [Bacteroidetes bacterium]|jgi:hypothetical protein|nr:acetolactate synthase [Bacteroidota bacterium]
MIIHQLSVFLENRAGRLAKALSVIGSEKIKIIALSVADTSDFGILRMIVSNAERAKTLLKENSFSANITDVIAVNTNSEAKYYSEVLGILSDIDISVEYTYAFKKNGDSVIILQCDDNQKAIKALTNNNISLMKAEDIYSI